jgi:hypothetical protein
MYARVWAPTLHYVDHWSVRVRIHQPVAIHERRNTDRKFVSLRDRIDSFQPIFVYHTAMTATHESAVDTGLFANPRRQRDI